MSEGAGTAHIATCAAVLIGVQVHASAIAPRFGSGAGCAAVPRAGGTTRDLCSAVRHANMARTEVPCTAALGVAALACLLRMAVACRSARLAIRGLDGGAGLATIKGVEACSWLNTSQATSQGTSQGLTE